jgi:cobalt-zinc-cadmium resistance protein CzcA
MQMRFNELISGVKSDVAVSVFGDDLDRMGATAREVAAVLAKVRGVSEARIGQTEGFPRFDVKIDRDAVARYGLTMQDVAETVSTALGGRPAGLLFNGDRRYPIIVRVASEQRNDLDTSGALPICPKPRCPPLPLRQWRALDF